MAIQLNFSNIFELFSLMAPVLLGFFLVMSSIFNQNLKGLVYLAGVLIAVIINIFLMNQIGSRKDATAAFSCDFVSIPFMSNFNSPAPTSLFIAFTIAYLVLPMQYNKQMNYVILAALLCLLVMDSVTKINKKCTTAGGTFLGALVGRGIPYSIFPAMIRCYTLMNCRVIRLGVLNPPNNPSSVRYIKTGN